MNCKNQSHENIRDKLLNSEQFNTDVENISKIFSLLGDCSRIKILLTLMNGELCVYHICEITGLKQSATSQHLRKLKDGNIVKSRKDGNYTLYSIADDHIKNIIKTALEHVNCSL